LKLPGEDSNLGQGLQRSWSCRLDDPGSALPFYDTGIQLV
jgi:hypothetical protein